jgi:hypothetical protein
MELARAIWQAVRDWFGNDPSGRINMVINLLILLAIVSTCSRVADNGERLERLESRSVQVEQQSRDEDVLKQRIVELLIQNLETAVNKPSK